MSDLRCDSKIIEIPGWGDILLVSFAGHYPPGSQGNATSIEIGDALFNAKTQHQPRALLIDFASLDYAWGDDIGGILLALARQDKQRNLFCPTCIVAQGQTARALDNLFTSCGLKYLINTEIVSTVEDGLKYLQSE